MKEDITQLRDIVEENITGCGLVMKEDITQQRGTANVFFTGCGLVMKEDITQQTKCPCQDERVVVW